MGMQISMINVETIVPNRFQPRKNFDQSELQDLAESIKRHGMIQPMVLRKLGNKYEIIAGERRYKAALMNGMITVPAIVMNLDDVTSAEVALLENVQRKDLTPIEEAQSYKQILQLGQITQDEMAKKMGKNQSTISNKLRLLNLSDQVQKALLENKISERHARSLLALKNFDLENKLLNKILEKRLTVRETDAEIKSMIQSPIEEEILEFDDESDKKEDTEIIDFDESEKKDKTPINELIPTTKEQIDNDNKEITQPKKRAKFFTLEENKNMNGNNIINQNSSIPTQQNSQDQIYTNVSQYNSEIPNQVGQEYQPPLQQPNLSVPFSNYQSNQQVVQPQSYNIYPQAITEQVSQQNSLPNQNNQQTDQTYSNQSIYNSQIPLQQYPQYDQYQNSYSPNFSGQTQIQKPQEYSQPEQTYTTATPSYSSVSSPYAQTNSSQMSDSTQQSPLSSESQVNLNAQLPQFGDGNMGVQEDVSQQSMITQQDITGAVSVIRNTIMNLQNNGYMLDAEEFDFENIHQITIKIQK